MKKVIGFFAAASLSLAAPAQRMNILEGADAMQWINMSREVQQNYDLTANFILNPPVVEFPPDIMDTLKTYDWLLVADYWYNYSDWGSDGINKIKYQNQFERYQEDGTVLDMGSWCGVGTPEVYDEGHNLQPPLYVKDTANYTWLCWDNGSPTDCKRLVYYQDGLLIIDLSDAPDGVLPPVNYKRRIRSVYLAMPKTF